MRVAVGSLSLNQRRVKTVFAKRGVFMLLRAWTYAMLGVAMAFAAPTTWAKEQAPAEPVVVQAVNQAGQDEQAIRALLVRYEQAMRQGDQAGIAATLHDDVVTTFQGKLTARGKAAVLQGYDASFVAMDFSTITYLVDEINVSGDLAVLSTYHPVDSFVVNKHTGKKILDHNRELFVLKKVAGQWRIYRYMYNQTPEQAK